MTKKKLKWERPKLIVLVKGNPEEAVLDACKGGWGGPNDPVRYYLNCMEEYQLTSCYQCSSPTST